MIKAVFFDFDGVLTIDPNGKTAIFRNLSAALGGMSEATIEQCYVPWNNESKCGRVEWKDIHEKFCACLGVAVPYEIMESSWKTVRKNESMFELAAKLKSNGYKTGIITSNPKERMDVLKQEHHLDDLFDVIVTSADVGSTKSEEIIFKHTLEQAACAADVCVFIDNHESNLVAAKRTGFLTYFYDHETNDINALRYQLKEWEVNV